LKLIAHRGWSEGGDENTLAAFARAASDTRLSGVEFDVCREAGSATLVVSHDPPLGPGSAPTLEAALAFLSGTEAELFVEIKQAGIAPAVIERLVAAGLAGRSVVFAFADVARSFPWREARPVRLGIITLYPWTMGRAVKAYAPDVILLGWDARTWTRIAFRAWWSVFSLERLAQRHAVAVVAGIAQREADIRWLSRQRIYAAVADMDRIDRSPPP
jgi:glycerophosphoryl diester phosphodiesterase